MIGIGNKDYKYFLLEEGDIMEAGDEWYNPEHDRWDICDDGEPSGEFINGRACYPDAVLGHEYDPAESKPVRRKNYEYSSFICFPSYVLLFCRWNGIARSKVDMSMCRRDYIQQYDKRINQSIIKRWKKQGLL